MCALFGSAAATAQFIRPTKPDAPRIWGVEGGVVVGLHPDFDDMLGRVCPRGLIRVGLMRDGAPQLLNFIAVEPLVGGKRGLSELEKGGDGAHGKRMWVSARHDRPATAERQQLAGRVRGKRGQRELSFAVHVEAFANGARPVVEITLFEAQPQRIRLRTYAAEGSAEIQQLALSATMGNLLRGRQLWLSAAPVHALDIYGDYRGHGFVEHGSYPLDELHRTGDGDAVVVLTPDEYSPRELWPFPDGGWRSPLPWVAQYWLKPAGTFDASLHCRVNGRRTYWLSRNPLPCGTAYENFELREDFVPGQEVWFGFTEESPQRVFGFGYGLPPHAPVTREVSAAEAAEIEAARQDARPLTNGDFAQGLDGWTAVPDAAAFRVFEAEGASRLSTFAGRRDGDTGRLWQHFLVPDDAGHLAFYLHGGCDRERLRVQLWNGDTLVRWATGRDDNAPILVQFDLRAQRGQVLTLEISDQSTRPWGFVGAHGFVVEPTRR